MLLRTTVSQSFMHLKLRREFKEDYRKEGESEVQDSAPVRVVTPPRPLKKSITLAFQR